jgi:hypothetical protein
MWHRRGGVIAVTNSNAVKMPAHSRDFLRVGKNYRGNGIIDGTAAAAAASNPGDGSLPRDRRLLLGAVYAVSIVVAVSQ